MKRLEDMTEPELRCLMIAGAWALEKSLRESGVSKPLFTLLVWNDPEIAQYISNCDRPSMIAALSETVERLRRKQDVPR